jgi:hypothetical protein
LAFTPVPEPNLVLFFTGALGGVTGVCRRRRNYDPAPVADRDANCLRIGPDAARR